MGKKNYREWQSLPKALMISIIILKKFMNFGSGCGNFKYA